MGAEASTGVVAAGGGGRRGAWISAVVVAVLAGAGLWARVAELRDRPMHTDEAVHAVKFGELLRTGGYRYDPEEYHGPILYYFNLPVAWWRGQGSLEQLDEATLRLVPAIFGAVLVLLCIGIGSGFGRGGSAWAAAFVAASPGLLYYSRYYIQEVPFVFFSFSLIVSGWRFSRRPSLGWAAAGGVAAGLMAASKETSIIAWFAMAVGLVVSAGPAGLRRMRWGLVAAGALCGVAVAVVWVTGFFTNPGVVGETLTTWLTYGHRAAGEGHEKPWYWYLEILTRKWRGGRFGPEVPVLALAGVAVVRLGFRDCRERRPLIVFLAVYGGVLLLAYSAIPYKTPWLILGVVHAAALLAGAGVAELLRVLRPWRCGWLAVAIGIGGVWQAGRSARLACGRLAADQSNPYVYSHTTRDLLRLVGNIREAAAFHSEGRGVMVKVMSPEYWPLPWYLRDFSNVGYWAGVPADAEAPIMVTTPELAAELEPRLKGAYAADFGGLRHGYLVVAYIRRDLWDAMVAARGREAGR